MSKIFTPGAYERICLIGEKLSDSTKVPDLKFNPSAITSFPREWFDNHKDPLVKPECTIPDAKPEDWPSIKSTVAGKFWEGELDLSTAMVFVFESLERNKGTLRSDWSSFERKIGKAGEKISLSNIFDIKRAGTLPAQLTPADVDERSLKAAFIGICSVFRLTQISHPDYLTQLSERVQTMVNGIIKDCTLPRALTTYRSWYQSPAFSTLMAGVDMFLQEFPEHPYAEARIGTIVTRFKDCSVLISTHQILDLLDLGTQQFSLWFYNRRAAIQYHSVLQTNQELENPRSYTPYFMQMKLADKSPYSASSCGTLHLFYHIIGCGLSSKRSQNARFIGEQDSGSLFKVGCLVAYVFGEKVDAEAAYGVDGLDENAELKKKRHGSRSDNEEPKGRDPAEWRRYIIQQNNTIPDNIIRSVCITIKQRSDYRDDTIGKWCFEKANAWLEDHDYNN